MRDSEYRVWLQTQGYQDSTVSTRISDARRIEEYLGDLDGAYEADRCEGLVARLAYSSADERAERPNPTDIPIVGNLREGLSSYKSAVTAYRRFRDAVAVAPGTALTREAVLAELEVCRAAGSLEAYLARFTDLGAPQTYWLVHAGQRYPSKAIVHGALGLKERKHGGTQCRQMLAGLGFLVLDARAYAEIRSNFLRRMEPFTSFRAQHGPYWEIERRYKDEIAGEVRAIAASTQSDAEAGFAICRKLALGKQGLPINWMALDTLGKAAPELREPAFAALGRLARSGAPADEAMLEAAGELERARAGGLEKMALGNVMGFVASVRGTVHPAEAAWFKITRMREAAQKLFDRKLFPSATVRAEDLADYGQVLRVLFALLKSEEGWEPADLMDVQGFLWVGLCTPEEWGETVSPAPDDYAAPIWLLSSRWGEDDGFDRFVEAGEWGLLQDTGSAYNQRVREVQPGDTVVMRDYVPRARELPFEAHGAAFSALRLRAIGRVIENRHDGLSLAIDWQTLEEPRTWYFYTNNDPIWRLKNPGESESADRLRRFILTNEPQDYSWFLANPYWRDRIFGAPSPTPEVRPVPDPVNLILYGPPGTGKTYATAREAVALCDGHAEYPETDEGRDALMSRYDELVKAKRVGFVTFHQSYSYEQFVEGLHPETGGQDESEPSVGFRLEPKPGIFREMAALALQASQRRAAPAVAGFSLAGRKFWKMGLGAIGSQDSVFEGAIAGGYVVLGWGGDVDWSDPRFEDGAEVRKEWESKPRADQSPSNYSQLYPFRAKMKVGDLVIVPFGNSAFRAVGEVTGNYEFNPTGEETYNHRRSVRWLLVLDEPLPLDTIVSGKFQMRTFYSIAESRVNAPALLRLIGVDDEHAAPVANPDGAPDQFVLIIDEINRANVSKVFGELITLIEPDKRLGKRNALKLRLPYSKEQEFGVPANLHIIGTMNTADRSIALLDTALRRRFQFREIAPEPALLAKAAAVTGIDLPAVLAMMNDRIEYLIDRDHRIGHAFFIGCTTPAEVDAVMRDKVIPLLQEYFFEDWSRIAAVVGAGFVGKRSLPVPPGLDFDEPKVSWYVHDDFLPERYAMLLGKAKPPLAHDYAANDEPGSAASDDDLGAAE